MGNSRGKNSKEIHFPRIRMPSPEPKSQNKRTTLMLKARAILKENDCENVFINDTLSAYSTSQLEAVITTYGGK